MFSQGVSSPCPSPGLTLSWLRSLGKGLPQAENTFPGGRVCSLPVACMCVWVTGWFCGSRACHLPNL